MIVERLRVILEELAQAQEDAEKCVFAVGRFKY